MNGCSCVHSFDKTLERIDDDQFITWPHYVGRHILICGRRSSRFPYQLMVGPDWPCMLVTYALVLVPTFFFMYDIGSIVGWWIFALGCSSGFLVLLFFTMTACSDPGIIYDYPGGNKSIIVTSTDVAEGERAGEGESMVDTPHDEELGIDIITSTPRPGRPVGHGFSSLPSVPGNNYIECGNCAMKRPTTASHCYDCGLCIDEIDHHCPWTGKCIAKKNIRTFYWFLASLSFHILLVLGISIYAIVTGYSIFKMPNN